MITLSCGKMRLTVCMCLSVMLLVYMCIFNLFFFVVDKSGTTSLSVISIYNSLLFLLSVLKEVHVYNSIYGLELFYDIVWSI